MEINVKEEQARVKAEVTQINGQLSLVNNQLAILQQQKQQLINALLEKSGELKLLERLDGKKGKGAKDS